MIFWSSLGVWKQNIGANVALNHFFKWQSDMKWPLPQFFSQQNYFMAIYRFFKYINPTNASTSIYLYMSISLSIFIYLYILYYIYIIYYICIIYIQLYICICIYIYIYLYIIGKKYSTSIPNSFHIMVGRKGGWGSNTTLKITSLHWFGIINSPLTAITQ